MADETWRDKYTAANGFKFTEEELSKNGHKYDQYTDELKVKGAQYNTLVEALTAEFDNSGATGGYTLDKIPQQYLTGEYSNPTDTVFTDTGGSDMPCATLYDLVKDKSGLKGQVKSLKNSPWNQFDESGTLGKMERLLDAYISTLLRLQARIIDLNSALVLDGSPDDIVEFGQALWDDVKVAADQILAGNLRPSEILKEIQKAKEKKQKAEVKRARAEILALTDPNENYLNLSFRDQCYIQKNLWNLIQLRRQSNFPKKTTLPKPELNSSIMSSGKPYGFINKLTQPFSTMNMFDMPNDVLSNLQPSVRFYKIVMDEKGNDINEVEITFPGNNTEADIKEIFKNKKRRGFGIGMKSFEWKMEGSDPFAAKRMIAGKLTLHATTFAELLRPRGTKDYPFKYADLAIKTGTTKLQELSPAACGGNTSGLSYESAYNVNFRLKVVVGYALPRNLSMKTSDRIAYESAIADCFASYDLVPTIHEFNFQEDGRVEFVINYQAYIQDYFDTSHFDIFGSANNTSASIYRIRMQKAFDSATAGARSSEQEDMPEKEDANAIRKLKTANLKSLLTRLFVKDRIYYYNIPYTELNQAISSNSMAPIYDSNDVMLNEDQVADDMNRMNQEAAATKNKVKKSELRKKAKNLQEQLERPPSVSSTANMGIDQADHRQVTFFFFYDLIDMILEGIQEGLDYYPKVLDEMPVVGAAHEVKKREQMSLRNAKHSFARLRVLLGPMEIRNPQEPCHHEYISMGEIPVSVKYFSEWMADKMLAKERISYNLSSFIEEFVKNYLSVFLNDTTCGGIKASQPSALHSTTIVSYARSEYDEITDQLLEQNRRAESVRQRTDMWNPSFSMGQTLNTMGSRNLAAGARNLGANPQRNWLVFYAGRTSPGELMQGDRFQDASRGIFHYTLGRDRGVVKNIRLTKTPAPMLKELRYEQEGYDGLMQLREVYNANVDMFLMPNTYPGMIIYIEPRGFAPSTEGYTAISEDAADGKPSPVDQFELSRYGIGGYYLITQASHRIAEGERNTQVNAVWLHGHDKGSQPSSGDPEAITTETSLTKVQKCCGYNNNNQNSANEGSGSPPPSNVDDVTTNPHDHDHHDHNHP